MAKGSATFITRSRIWVEGLRERSWVRVREREVGLMSVMIILVHPSRTNAWAMALPIPALSAKE